MPTIRDNALSFLYRELRAAKIALGRAEGRPGVTREELDNLQKKIDAIDYLTPLAVTAEHDDGCPLWAVKRMLSMVQKECKKHFNCTECPLRDGEECVMYNVAHDGEMIVPEDWYLPIVIREDGKDD